MLDLNNIRSNNRRISYAYSPRGKFYEELGDGVDIQIHSQNKRFVERIKEAYERLKENPIGIRLVDDIRRLRMDKKDPCWIVECNQQYAGGVEIYPLKDSSFLFKTEGQIADLIYIDIDQNFHYYGFHKEDPKGKHPNEIIPLQKFISDPSELDITLFHEMNHYQHYLQVGCNVYNERQEWYSISQADKYNTMMVSDEEALQLTGRLYRTKDPIYEMSYRANRLNTPIRYPYAANDEYEPNEYVKSRATAGYLADLLTPN